ncbi:MAG TPA: CopD family protein, partial [Alphaproteobacteria bacterium]|nr:CopD family protein [Alphaproteobacteria bacterium]
MEFLAPLHLWIKALHIIAVIAWMAGMLYLPRLFVYHSDAPVGTPQSETFKVMERKLLRIIINPSMILTWLLGGLMLSIPGLIDWSRGFM